MTRITAVRVGLGYIELNEMGGGALLVKVIEVVVMDKVAQIWEAWTGLFHGIPNGDPYVATFVLLVLSVITMKMIRSAIESI